MCLKSNTIRVIWGILVIIALIAAVTLLCLAWISFQENPTFVVTDSTQYPIWNYPFPGVTVCNFNKISKKRVYALAQNLSDSSNPKIINQLAFDLRILFQLINLKIMSIPYQNYSRLQNLLDAKKMKPMEILKSLAPTCEETLQRCKWKGEEKRCESLFEMIPTTEGFCCSFNYFALKNHTFEGYLAHKAPSTPRRVSACGYQTGLEVLLYNDPEEYFLTQIPSIGHRILIHNSYHFPDSSVQTVLTERKLVNLLDILPTLTYSTDRLRELEIGKRNCLLFRERDLLNFNGYTRHNCIIECRMNLTLEYCECIPLIFYNEKGTYPNARICDLRDVFCLSKYSSVVFSALPGHEYNSLTYDRVHEEELDTCQCLPDCDYVEYTAEPSSGKLNRAYATNQLNLYGGLDIDNQSVFRVFFDDLVATRNRRDVTFSWHTLLAYYGGLLGLFVGFSFVSAIEVIYFFTIRLISDLVVKSKSIAKEPNLKSQRQKIQVQPVDNFEPRKLIIPKDNGTIRHRLDSEFMHYT